MKFCPECGFQFPSGTEKFCPNCGYDINKGVTRVPGRNDNSINIENTGGNVIGVGVSGSGNIIGKDITINKGSYNKLEPEFKTSLNDLMVLMNRHGDQLSGEQRESIKDSLDGLAKATEGVRANQKVQDEEKRNEIRLQQITLADKIVKYVPKVAESIVSATPLAPFSKVIGEGSGYFAEWIKEKLRKK
jgi:hypothetical protein